MWLFLPLWTWGGSKVAEVHGKLDVIKFLLLKQTCQTNLKIYFRKLQKGLKQESKFLAIQTFLANFFL